MFFTIDLSLKLQLCETAISTPAETLFSKYNSHPWAASQDVWDWALPLGWPGPGFMANSYWAPLGEKSNHSSEWLPWSGNAQHLPWAANGLGFWCNLWVTIPRYVVFREVAAWGHRSSQRLQPGRAFKANGSCFPCRVLQSHVSWVGSSLAAQSISGSTVHRQGTGVGRKLILSPWTLTSPQKHNGAPFYRPLPVIHAVSPLFLFHDETCRL